MTKLQLITKGLVKDNPTFVLILGMCPTLATTSSAINGLSMGLATLFVLILSNIVISAIAPAVPDKVHIPVYIRGYRYVRDCASASYAGLCPCSLCYARIVHPSYRGELYRARTRRGLRQQERHH